MDTKGKLMLKIENLLIDACYRYAKEHRTTTWGSCEHRKLKNAEIIKIIMHIHHYIQENTKRMYVYFYDEQGDRLVGDGKNGKVFTKTNIASGFDGLNRRIDDEIGDLFDLGLLNITD